MARHLGELLRDVRDIELAFSLRAFWIERFGFEQMLVDYARCLGGGINQTYFVAKHLPNDRFQQRIVRTAEYQRIDPVVLSGLT